MKLTLYQVDAFAEKLFTGNPAAHSQLVPFWSEKLGKQKMQAKQLSPRGGHLWVEQKGERVIMAGKCVFYMKGEVKC